MASYDDVVRRWLSIVLYGDDRRNLSNPRMPVHGDCIYSYGTHFEMARLIRDKKGESSHFLINGARFSNTTSKHQAIVRNAIAGSGIPSVTIPYPALEQADIDLASVQIVDVTNDRIETWVETRYEMPESAHWDIIETTIEQEVSHYETAFGPGRYEWQPTWTDRVKVVDVPAVKAWYRVLREGQGWRTWTVDWSDGAWVYTLEHSRHWLGESLITGRVGYWANVRCPDCKGEGAIAPWLERIWVEGVGPAWAPTTDCPNCRATGRVRVRRHRTATFLSGFDHGETRPSYFFCELPPKAKPTTIAEAYEALKPDTVRYAESIGREVKRQGDIFAVPMSLDTRTLTSMGAVRTKRGRLLGTNHLATETAVLRDGTVLARGTLTHAPEFRRPDHRRVSLGKGWHVIVKNTVPVAA